MVHFGTVTIYKRFMNDPFQIQIPISFPHFFEKNPIVFFISPEKMNQKKNRLDQTTV